MWCHCWVWQLISHYSYIQAFILVVRNSFPEALLPFIISVAESSWLCMFRPIVYSNVKKLSLSSISNLDSWVWRPLVQNVWFHQLSNRKRVCICCMILAYCKHQRNKFRAHWRTFFCCYCGFTLITGAYLSQTGCFTVQNCFQLLWLKKLSADNRGWWQSSGRNLIC